MQMKRKKVPINANEEKKKYQLMQMKRKKLPINANEGHINLMRTTVARLHYQVSRQISSDKSSLMAN